MLHSDPLIESLLTAALNAAQPDEAIRRNLRCVDSQLIADGTAYALQTVSDVLVVAVGKAASPMAAAVREILHNIALRCIIVTKHGHASPSPESSHLHQVTVIQSGHPIPDENSLRAGNLVCEALTGLTAQSLIIACISGGASALMVAPHPGISLATMRAINDALLRSGADITEMNAVRSRLDRLKAGGFVRMCAPARVLGLVLSDVIGDPLDVIASGLTHVPAEPRVRNVLVGNNTKACEAVRDAFNAVHPGAARIVTCELRGEASTQGRAIAAGVCGWIEQGREREPLCLIYGGETTVTVRGTGAGGRNTELALAAAIELDRRLSTQQLQPSTHVAIVALATDGSDGPTDAAGAVATIGSVQRAAGMGLRAADFLARNDSHRFFAAIDGLLTTGATGTNVADVIVALCVPRASEKSARGGQPSTGTWQK